MATKICHHPLILSLTVIFLHVLSSDSAPLVPPEVDANALLKLKGGLKDDSNMLANWVPNTLPCMGNKNIWSGVICTRSSHIWGLKLEDMKLSGHINVDALGELPRLRSISFMNNNFGGQMPDFRKLRAMKGIYLSNNHFEGKIDPNAFDGLRRLKKVHLANNKFSGGIPISLSKLTKLVELRLEGNQFQGVIPDFAANTMLEYFNVSNNQLQGHIPASVAKFDTSAFAGNQEICGPPMGACSTLPSANQKALAPPQSTSETPIPILAIVGGVILAMILAVLVYLMVIKSKRCNDRRGSGNENGGRSHRRVGSVNHKRSTTKNIDDGGDEGSIRSTSNKNLHQKPENNGKLTFVREDRERFDLPDLLKAAAEILGSGCFGSSYKASLNNGSAVVVKRFKQMNNVGREEFQEHMRRLGKVSHPNLLPLVAYYYRKEEKLFITDPIARGSLAVLLHGQSRGKPTLDWPTRLKVIKGVAKGLSHLYEGLPSLVAPHGHLKSSNVLLNASFEPVLSDYGLIPLINQESAQELVVAYKSPEYVNTGRVTKKTDVWALGILIIETLTGRFPAAYLQQGGDVDMEAWVKSVVEGGFDKNMSQTKNSDGELQKMLAVGLACCESVVDKRLDIKQACERIEEVTEKDNDDDYYSSYASTEADVRSSRGMSDDFTVIIT